MSRARSSPRLVISSKARDRIAERSLGAVLPHPAAAAAAAASAAAASSTVAEATRARNRPVAGSRTSSSAPSEAGTTRPPIISPVGTAVRMSAMVRWVGAATVLVMAASLVLPRPAVGRPAGAGRMEPGAEGLRAERVRQRGDRPVPVVVDNAHGELEPFLHGGHQLLGQHQVGAVADECEDMPVRGSELGADGAGDLIAHAGVAVLDVVSLCRARSPKPVQAAGHRP